MNCLTASFEFEHGAMSAEIIRIFAETDLKAVGRRAQETIPMPWERLIPMVEERYREIIRKFGIKN